MKILPKLNVLLSLCVAVLVVRLFLDIRNTYYPRIQDGKQRESQLPVLLPEVPVGKQESFKTKPLFNINTGAKQPKEKENFILLGVSLGKRNLAMIRDTLGNKDWYCTEGDTVAGFKVKRISKDQVVLESGPDTLVLTR